MLLKKLSAALVQKPSDRLQISKLISIKGGNQSTEAEQIVIGLLHDHERIG